MATTRARGAAEPRIADVARVAGVSVGTVSNVLNRPAAVSDALRGRVETAIAELGFVRHGLASVLAAGRSRNVGMVALNLNNSLFVDVAQGAQHAARAYGLNVLLADSGDDGELQREHVRFFDEARMAGVLLAPMEDASAQIRMLSSHGRPTIVLNFDPPGSSSVSSVVVDNEQAGFLAASHLISRGCRRLVFLGGGGTGDHFQPVRLRRQGVRRAVSDAAARGEPVRFEELDSADLNTPSGRVVGRALLSRGPLTRPDGVIGVTDGLAAGVVEEFVAAGVRIPEDVLVMGCDHNSAAWGGPVPLTTIAMRGREMGEAAIRLLIDELEAPDGAHAHQRVVLEPHLVERASTAG